jgi:hypothetical protein
MDQTTTDKVRVAEAAKKRQNHVKDKIMEDKIMLSMILSSMILSFT